MVDIYFYELGVILAGIQEKSLSIKITYWIRNLLSKPLFTALNGDLGKVLDIGGGSFYKSLRDSTWTEYVVFEPDVDFLPEMNASRVYSVSGDGLNPPFKSETFDTILIIQVLQFIFEPNLLIKNISKIIKDNGKIIIQVPQSGNLHGIPNHYYNFTKFWLNRILSENNFEIINHYYLGGAWRTIASRLFLMFWPVFRHKYYLDPQFKKRGYKFWITFPIQVLIAGMIFPTALLLSLFDIKEEANNHLVVAIKRPSRNYN